MLILTILVKQKSKQMNRRESIQTLGLAAGALLVPGIKGCTGESRALQKQQTEFKYCLNTSTIRGQKQGLLKDIETAARAGYDSIELWIRDIESFLSNGNTLQELNRYIKDTGIEVASAIGFAPWMSDIDEISKQGFAQMRKEMEMMAALGCQRIAAPPAGTFKDNDLDLFEAGYRYRELLALGRETGVMPQLEFWGSSDKLFHMGQILMMAAVASDDDTRLLPDIYHMFRGGSGYETLNMISGHMIEIFHMNDFPSTIKRTDQKDADRVYPGDGAAPMQKIMQMLSGMGGTMHLSLELFNPDYWEKDALEVSRTGLQKMQQL